MKSQIRQSKTTTTTTQTIFNFFEIVDNIMIIAQKGFEVFYISF